jgi:hypothetical protein
MHLETIGHLSLTASTDGADPVQCDGRLGAQGSRALIYWADNLRPGKHKITIANTGVEGEFLNLDYFEVTQSCAPIFPIVPGLAHNQFDRPKQNSLPPGSIAAAVVGSVTVLILLLTALWFILTRRRRKRQRERLEQEKRASELIVPWTTSALPPSTTANTSTLFPQQPAVTNLHSAHLTYQAGALTSTATPLPASRNQNTISYSHTITSIPSTSTGSPPARARSTLLNGAGPNALVSQQQRRHSYHHRQMPSHQPDSVGGGGGGKPIHNGPRPSIEGAGSPLPMTFVQQNTASAPRESPPPYSQNHDQLPV